MHKLALYMVLSFFMSACADSGPDKNEPAGSPGDDGRAMIVFDKDVHDFGRVTEGEQVGWYFTFKNEGTANLLISKATSTCGCTVPDFDKSPLPPGASGRIKVLYDSRGRSGKEIKTVSIHSNSETPVHQLKLIVEVIR